MSSNKGSGKGSRGQKRSSSNNESSPSKTMKLADSQGGGDSAGGGGSSGGGGSPPTRKDFCRFLNCHIKKKTNYRKNQIRSELDEQFKIQEKEKREAINEFMDRYGYTGNRKYIFEALTDCTCSYDKKQKELETLGDVVVNFLIIYHLCKSEKEDCYSQYSIEKSEDKMDKIAKNIGISKLIMECVLEPENEFKHFVFKKIAIRNLNEGGFVEKLMGAMYIGTGTGSKLLPVSEIFHKWWQFDRGCRCADIVSIEVDCMFQPKVEFDENTKYEFKNKIPRFGRRHWQYSYVGDAFLNFVIVDRTWNAVGYENVTAEALNNAKEKQRRLIAKSTVRLIYYKNIQLIGAICMDCRNDGLEEAKNIVSKFLDIVEKEPRQ